ncbi:MAG: hypothetical protein HFH45_01765 [Bacilli bacterium]|nr:hypothetical protein [Bacilli bacterium]
MLTKLLKYDLKNIFKFLIIFYSLSIIGAISTRICFNIENSFILEIIAQICSGFTIAMIINILINNIIKLWVRFKNNLYGDESYLTHTLPVSKKDIYLSKILTTIISLFISTLVIALTLFIAYYSKENVEALKNFLLPIATAYGSTIIKIISSFLFILFLQFANTVQAGFTGIILGHKMNQTKIGFSVIFGYITYTITQLFALFITFITALFNKDLMNLFITNQIIDVEIVKVTIYLSIIIYTITLIIGYFINIKLLKQGINVE